MVVSQYGELSKWIQSNSFDFDSIAIHGPIDSSDMSAIANTGRLRVVNLDKAIAENGYIPDRAFNISLSPDKNPVRLTKIIFPGNTVEIGENVLNNETVDIILPPTLRTLHEQAFYGAKSLNPSPLVIPEGVTVIPKSCFAYCSELSEVRLPSTLRLIDDGAFGLSGPLKISFPENLEEIGNFAFTFTEIQEAIIPDNCTEIGYGAFSSCYDLHTLVLPEKLKVIHPQIADLSYSLYYLEIPASVEIIESSAFYNAKNLKQVIFNEGLREIHAGVFRLCRAMENISLPSTLTKIGEDVFPIHGNLKFIRVKAPVPPVCEENAFYLEFPFSSDNLWNVPVFVPAGSSGLYKNASVWKNFRNFIEE